MCFFVINDVFVIRICLKNIYNYSRQFMLGYLSMGGAYSGKSSADLLKYESSTQ